MKNFFKMLGRTLRDLFTSKKFLVTAGATMASIAAGQDPKTAIMVGGAAYVGAQGMADFGKSAKAPTAEGGETK